MDILAIWTTIGIVLLLDWLAIKYSGSVLIFLMAGVVSMYALANLAADNSVDSWHFVNASGTIINDFWTPTADPHSFMQMIGILSILAIVNFTMALQKQLGGEKQSA